MTKFFRGGGCAVSSRNSHRRDERRAQLTGLLDASGTALRLAAPLVDLLVRFSLAKVFFAPGMLPSSHLFQFVQTGWPTIIVQVGGPVLLAAGLWVRPVALLMLVLTLLAQTSGPLQDEHLFWAALFGWYVAQGAGPLSLDHVLGKGLGLSPLPLAGRAMAAADWFDRWVGPLYRLLVRLWLAVALAGVALAPGMLPVTASAMLPATASGMLLRPWALFAAALLTLGLGTPLVAAGLLVAGTSMALAGTGHAMTVYAPLLLALLGVSGAGPYSLDFLIATRMRRPAPPADDALISSRSEGSSQKGPTSILGGASTLHARVAGVRRIPVPCAYREVAALIFGSTIPGQEFDSATWVFCCQYSPAPIGR